MREPLVQIFIGWPALITSLIIWVAGLVMKKYIIVLTAGIVILPFSLFYIGAYLNSIWLGLLFSLGHFGSAVAIQRHKLLGGWLFTLTYTLFVGMLAYIVLSQR